MKIPKANEVKAKLQGLGDLTYPSFVALQSRINIILDSIFTNTIIPFEGCEFKEVYKLLRINEGCIQMPWQVRHSVREFSCPKLDEWLKGNGYYPVFVAHPDKEGGYIIQLKLYFEKPSSD